MDQICIMFAAASVVAIVGLLLHTNQWAPFLCMVWALIVVVLRTICTVLAWVFYPFPFIYRLFLGRNGLFGPSCGWLEGSKGPRA